MRVIPVDERTSTWERDDPRYRLTVYEGAGFATTTFDILDAPSIDAVLDTADRLAGIGERLWSLTLVSHDELGAEGLVWLSGRRGGVGRRGPAAPRRGAARARGHRRGAAGVRAVMAPLRGVPSGPVAGSIHRPQAACRRA